MRRAAKVDANQGDVVKALRDAFASVQPLHGVGKGCPDLLVGYQGRNFLLEVKDENASKRDQKLRERQVEWHSEWRGQVCTVNSPEAALAAIGVIPIVGSIS